MEIFFLYDQIYHTRSLMFWYQSISVKFELIKDNLFNTIISDLKMASSNNIFRKFFILMWKNLLGKVGKTWVLMSSKHNVQKIFFPHKILTSLDCYWITEFLELFILNKKNSK